MKPYRTFRLLMLLVALVLIGTRVDTRGKVSSAGEPPVAAENVDFDEADLTLVSPPIVPPPLAQAGFGRLPSLSTPSSHIGEVPHEPPERCC